MIYYRLRRVLQSAKNLLQIGPSTVFFLTFDMDQLEKIRRYYWKERLEISKNCQV